MCIIVNFCCTKVDCNFVKERKLLWNCQNVRVIGLGRMIKNQCRLFSIVMFSIVPYRLWLLELTVLSRRDIDWSHIWKKIYIYRAKYFFSKNGLLVGKKHFNLKYRPFRMIKIFLMDKNINSKNILFRLLFSFELKIQYTTFKI